MSETAQQIPVPSDRRPTCPRMLNVFSPSWALESRPGIVMRTDKNGLARIKLLLDRGDEAALGHDVAGISGTLETEVSVEVYEPLTQEQRDALAKYLTPIADGTGTLVMWAEWPGFDPKQLSPRPPAATPSADQTKAPEPRVVMEGMHDSNKPLNLPGTQLGLLAIQFVPRSVHEVAARARDILLHRECLDGDAEAWRDMSYTERRDFSRGVVDALIAAGVDHVDEYASEEPRVVGGIKPEGGLAEPVHEPAPEPAQPGLDPTGQPLDTTAKPDPNAPSPDVPAAAPGSPAAPRS